MGLLGFAAVDWATHFTSPSDEVMTWDQYYRITAEGPRESKRGSFTFLRTSSPRACPTSSVD